MLRGTACTPVSLSYFSSDFLTQQCWPISRRVRILAMSFCYLHHVGLFIRLPTSVSAAATGRIYVQFGMGDFCVSLVRKVKFGQNRAKNRPLYVKTRTFHCYRRNFIATKVFSSLLGTITHRPVSSIGAGFSIFFRERCS